MKSLATYLEDCLASAKACNNSPDTLNMLRHGGRQLIGWLDTRFAIHEPDRLTSQHLTAWVEHVGNRTKRNGLPLKPHTVAKQYSTDRTFVRWLESQGLVPVGLHQAIPLIKLPRLLPTSVLPHKHVVRMLGKIDLASPEGIQLRTMLEVLYGAGLRVHELLSLTTVSIDLDSGLVRVMGKGSKERIVPVGESARDSVQRFLLAVRPLLRTDTSTNALWLDCHGRSMPKYTFRRRVEALCMGIKLPVHVTPYTFRRSFATELIIHGANPYAVAILLGHKNMDSIDHYVKLAAVELKRVHRRYHPRERDRK
jgi:integrase/recombinase XerD